MHYHKKVWSKGKRNSMRARIRLYNVPLYPEIDIVDPRKALAFQRWLERQPRYYPHAIMLYLMQWLGMRYLEVVKARADLDSPTLKVDWTGGWVTVWGKDWGGLSKRRTLPLTPEAARRLRDYLRWRRGREISSPWLFVTRWGRPWSEASWGYNKLIRTRCLPAYNQWVRSRGRPEAALSGEEVRKMTTHRMGRHVFGTIYAAHLPASTLMEYMGIVRFYVAWGYINFSVGQKVEQFGRATAALFGRGTRRHRGQAGTFTPPPERPLTPKWPWRRTWPRGSS